VGIDKSENLWLISTPSPFIPLPLGGEGGIKKKEGLPPLLNCPTFIYRTP